MQILHYSPNSESGFMYAWPRYHYIDELQRTGHKVFSFNPINKIGRIGSAAEYSQLLLDEVKLKLKSGELNMLFTSAYDKTIEASVIKEISRLGVPTVLMHCDDLSVPFIIKKIAGSFDLVWATARENLDLLKSYGANVIMMPYAANPNIFKPVPTMEERYIGFIGSVYGIRKHHLEKISTGGVSVRIFGNNQEIVKNKSQLNNPLARALNNINNTIPHTYQSVFFKTGRQIVMGALKRSFLEILRNPITQQSINPIRYLPGPSFSEMGIYYSRMAMSYGSIEYGSTYVLKNPLMCIHLREFEASMCGAVHIVNKTPELQEYFEEDKEMIFFSTYKELIDKVKYYLDPARDAVKRQIRIAARERAHKEHSWTRRFEMIWKSLGITNKSLKGYSI